MATRQAFDTINVLRMQVEGTWPGLRNIVPNPTGEAGTWGWRSKASAAAFDVVAGPAFRFIRQTAVGTQNVATDFLPLEKRWGPGSGDRWIKGSVRYVGGAAIRVNVSFFDKARVVMTTTTLSTSTTTPGTIAIPAVAVPNGAFYAAVNVWHNTLTSGTALDFTDVILVFGTQAAVTASVLTVEAPWVDILNPSTSIAIVREGLNVGTMTATVRDSTLDPATANTIRKGKRVRVQALSGGVWSYLFNGKVDVPTVTYDLAHPVAAKRTRIELTAVDRNSTLAATPRTGSVKTIAALPDVLDNAGVPFRVNGSTAGTLPTTPVAVDPNGNALSQVGLTRDTANGYAWMSRDGILTAWDRTSIPTTPVVTYTETGYADIQVGFNPADIINDVTVKVRSYGPLGEPIETTFGPYADDVSSLEWGRYHKDFSVAGAMTEAQADAFAAAVFTNNAQPRVRVNSIRLTVATVADIASKGLLDLYDVTTVVNTAKGLNQNLRPSRIVHNITGRKWLMEVGFDDVNTTSSPMTQPNPRGSVFAPASTSAGVIGVGAGAIVLGTNVNLSSEGVNAYRIEGGAVLAVYVNTSAVVAAGVTVLTLPVGWRPPRVIRAIMSTTGTNHIGVTVLPSGILFAEVALASGALLWGSLTLPRTT